MTQAKREAALKRAVHFLLGKRLTDDGANGRYWRDFNAYTNESDEWVTAYTAYALAETELSEGTQAACEAWEWLIYGSCLHGSGLGYSRLSPQDADSTAWGLRLAAMLGRSKDTFAREAYDFLTTFVRPDGGIGTFSAPGALAICPGKNPSDVAGWTASHTCVTGPAAWLLEIAGGNACRFLANTQQKAGFWRAYWWADDEYATAHAVESLAATGDFDEAVQRGASWLKDRHSRSSFTLALQVLGMAKGGEQHFETALDDLLALQNDDGSWPPSARLRIPAPFLKEPHLQWNWDEGGNGIGCIMVDHRRVFTTATAVRALSACRRR
ncbi:MAG TPA: hypothetical protein VFA65_12250 [Bryobacteraceae bacterium]|nr:hypothetical protein [Bryobacteraceae bacterium]